MTPPFDRSNGVVVIDLALKRSAASWPSRHTRWTISNAEACDDRSAPGTDVAEPAFGDSFWQARAMDRFGTIAAANNAEWCDLVCRTHGLETTLDDGAWTSRLRTPPYYPDAVTLVPDPSVQGLLARVDATPGCSIKDSFASIDLSTFGFRVLLDAEWIVRPPTSAKQPRTNPPWDVVRAPELFALWERAWRGHDGPPGVLRVELLAHESVKVLAARVGDRVVAGAVLNHSSAAVGISNFFADPEFALAGWTDCLALADTLFPGSTLVGYEAGDRLDAARTNGFEAAGLLRVWSIEA